MCALPLVALAWILSLGGTRARQQSGVGPMPYTEAAVNNAALHPNLIDHATGPAVLRLQILLDRAHFSVSQSTGVWEATP